MDLQQQKSFVSFSFSFAAVSDIFVFSLLVVARMEQALFLVLSLERFSTVFLSMRTVPQLPDQQRRSIKVALNLHCEPMTMTKLAKGAVGKGVDVFVLSRTPCKHANTPKSSACSPMPKGTKCSGLWILPSRMNLVGSNLRGLFQYLVLACMPQRFTKTHAFFGMSCPSSCERDGRKQLSRVVFDLRSRNIGEASSTSVQHLEQVIRARVLIYAANHLGALKSR